MQKIFYNIIKLFLVWSAFIEMLFGTIAFAREPSPFYYYNNQKVRIRDAKLNSLSIVDSGAKIKIDPNFLLQTLGTENPTQDQVQRLLLNPEEASKGKIVTQKFYNNSSGTFRNDYFFDVQVETKDGKTLTGKMALQAYHRMGITEIKRTDGENPITHQPDETTEKVSLLQSQNMNLAEGRICQNCSAPANNPPAQSIAEIARVLEEGPKGNENNLWQDFQNFAREFTLKNRTISRANAGTLKRLYLKELFEKFGLEKSAKILTALTGFSEAPSRSSYAAQIAEIAAVQKVIFNRAALNFRTRSRTLRDIGISESVNSIISTILADWQFSAWNDRDHNLIRMLNFNPDRADIMTKRSLMYAFESQDLIKNGQIKFLGKMNDSRMFHYHANYVNPSWERAANRVSSPIVQVNDIQINLAQNRRGPRHIFYAGIN
jgi:hypothetical protein